ncbi:MAG: hypothetical protein AAFZ07_01785 [Actinomycetota bacterium]
MIDIVAEHELRQLAEASDEHCISIYLPTHRIGREAAADRIRFKNAVAGARRDLLALGLRSPVADALLGGADALTHDERLWSHLDAGLAVFASATLHRAHRLPGPVPELVVVSDRFHIKPLVPLTASDETFHVLALSQSDVRVFRGTRYELTELELGSIPHDLATALRFDDRESQLQSHGAQRTGTGRVARRFHGHGVGVDTKDADLGRFLAAVDDGLAELVGDRPAPLVLAGVDSTVARFRALSSHPRIVRGEIEGSAAALTAAELHARSWPLVQEVFLTPRRRALAAVEDRVAQVVETLAVAVVAALDGRVSSVFVPAGVQRWGRIDAERRRVEEHADRIPGDRDLLDAVAVETLTHGGEVFVVEPSEMPLGAGVVALLRY